MKKVVLVMCGVFALSTWLNAQSAFIEQGLIEWLDEASPADQAPILLMMEDRVDLKAMKDEFYASGIPVTERPRIVMQALKAKASESQKEVMVLLSETTEDFSNLKTFWINNTVALKGNATLILALADLPGVERIDLDNAVYGLTKPQRVSGAQKSEGGIEPGLAAINAPEMWAMGYTGHGRVAMTFDSGVVTDHPSHSDRFLATLLPLQSTWFAYDLELPGDKPSSHGTHVTGTMLGLDEATADTVGVAPRAYYIATDPIVSNAADIKPLSELMLAYEWAMNPDGDENTSDDVPDVINNSWGRSNDVEDQDWDLCPDFVAETYTALEAAGIANVCSAGNNGPGPESIGVPHNINTGLVNSFTVGAVNGNSTSLPIADFSSRGPSLCGGEGSILIKPEVSAPGVSVRSSIANGEYDFFQGTSMAAPHVSGAVLLLKEAYPMASGEDILMALYLSATDLGEFGEDNTFGSGIINVKAAYDYLADDFTPVAPQEFIADIEITEIVSPTFELGCSGPGEHSMSPVVRVKYTGAETLDQVTFRYSINEGPEQVFISDDAFPSGSEEEFELSPITYSGEGIMELHISLDEITDEYDAFNNNKVHRWRELNSSIEEATAFSEDFSEGIDESLWFRLNEDGEVTWDTLSVIQADGTVGVAAWMDHPGYNVIDSQKDYLVTPGITNTSAGDDLVLTYDYYYRKRTSNNFQQDTFAVYLNEVCDDGLESVELLRKAGEELYTNDDNQSDALPESADEWVQETISVPELSGDGTYYFSFVTRNRRGNNFLIDNIFFGGALSLREQKRVEFSLFPNPSNGSFTVSSKSEENITFASIFDLAGRQIHRQVVNAPLVQMENGSLAPGVYLVQIELASGETGSKRLVIQ